MKNCLLGYLGCWGVILFVFLLFWLFVHLTDWQTRNESLPKGAKKYKGPLNQVLRHLHDERVRFYRDQGVSLRFEPSAFDSLGTVCTPRDWDEEKKPDLCAFLFGKRHPIVANYAWDQAFAIQVQENDNYLLFYESFVGLRDSPRPYLLYTLGAVSKKEIELFVGLVTKEFNRIRAEAEASLQKKP